MMGVLFETTKHLHNKQLFKYQLSIGRSMVRLAVAMALQGKVGECISFWGICCSSWIHMNSGTSCRNELTPMGCEAYKSVQIANILVSRLAIDQNGFNLCSKGYLF